MNQISSDVIKMASKKARLSETEQFTELMKKKKKKKKKRKKESLWNILSDNYKIRQEKE